MSVPLSGWVGSGRTSKVPSARPQRRSGTTMAEGCWLPAGPARYGDR
ncbi:Uncharacterised protein [Bordetella pertussis]|nr:Uncharacterised protein [Bordetella pertussis]